ncbi:MAG TPA: response regulator, partial [Lentimicrobium sp.]|nr:response regulator [Lentimicrobium sp.]
MRKVLIVDDDVTFCLMLETFLRKNGFDVEQSFSFSDAVKKIKSFVPDIILTDLRLPDHDGLEVLHLSNREAPNTPVILMTGYADIKTAVQAIKLGAFDYVAKPVNPDEILLTIKRALKSPGNEANQEEPAADDNLYVEGTSQAALKIAEYAALVAPTGMSVLILGESGTGKEFIARKIHQL